MGLKLARQDGAALLGIAGVTALAWAYVIWLARAMDMTGVAPGADMSHMIMPAFVHWTASDAVFMFAMWAIMMVGMMVPSAAPMILLYNRVGAAARGATPAFASWVWFAAGYVAAWAGFAAVATAGQWVLEQFLLLTPSLASASRVFGAALLLLAGLYQWTPIKAACLAYCSAPLTFIQRHGGFQGTRKAAIALGFRHGLYCIGCCWALMALLFVGGVMSLLWIAGLTVVVLAEKVLPFGAGLARVSGAVLIAAALVLLIR